MGGLELHLQSRFSFGVVQLHDMRLLKPEVVSGTAPFFFLYLLKKRARARR